MHILPAGLALLAAAVPLVAAPRDLVTRAAALMGGENAIIAVTGRTSRLNETIVVNFAQEDWPGAPKSMVSGFTTEYVDLVGGRVHTARPLSFAAPAGGKVPMSRLFATPRGGDFMNDTTWVRVPARTIQAARMLQLLSSVDYLMRSALRDPDLKPAGRSVFRGRDVNGVAFSVEGVQVRLWFDATEGFPLLADWLSEGTAGLAGEVTVEFAAWSKFGDLRLPRVRRVAVNGEPFLTSQLASTEANAVLDDSLFRFPDSSRMDATIPIAVSQLAPDVYRVAGATHASIAVRQEGELLLLEAPVSRSHVKAVLDTLRGRFPSLRITRFMSSHVHGDHLSGTLEAFDAGMTAYVPDEQRAVYGQFGRRWTDARAPRRNLIGVQDSVTIGRGPSRVIIHHIPTTHSWGLLVAYLPEYGILLEADLQNSGPTTRRELRDFVVARGWAVKQLVGVHGPPTTWDAFAATIK